MASKEEVFVIEVVPGRYNAYQAASGREPKVVKLGLSRKDLCELLCEDSDEGSVMAIVPNTETGPPGNPTGEPPPFRVREFIESFRAARLRMFTDSKVNSWNWESVSHAIRTQPIPDLVRMVVSGLTRN